MYIIYTKHAEEKFPILKRLGWVVTKKKISNTLKDPKWRGFSRFGQETVISLLDSKHILRVIYERENGILRIITFHPARRGTYESTL